MIWLGALLIVQVVSFYTPCPSVPVSKLFLSSPRVLAECQWPPSRLGDFWGINPVLFRSSFPDPLECWPDYDDIRLLTSDEDVEVRLIKNLTPLLTPPDDPGPPTYNLEFGPFSPSYVTSTLSSSSPHPFSFILNDVDRFFPPLADWMKENFDCVPNWRRDDGQVSLSNTGGGIDLHVDDYDVFLIQTSGTRDWTVELDPIDVDEELKRSIPDLPLRVLSLPSNPATPSVTVTLKVRMRMTPCLPCLPCLPREGRVMARGRKYDIITDKAYHPTSHSIRNNTNNVHAARFACCLTSLPDPQPGDMLYIPPRYPHKGVALSDRCMTLSVGFRAPSALDLLSDFVELKSEEASHPRFNDIGLPLSPSPGLITTSASERARSILRDSITEFLDDDIRWGEFFGKVVSKSKR